MKRNIFFPIFLFTSLSVNPLILGMDNQEYDSKEKKDSKVEKIAKKLKEKAKSVLNKTKNTFQDLKTDQSSNNNQNSINQDFSDDQKNQSLNLKKFNKNNSNELSNLLLESCPEKLQMFIERFKDYYENKSYKNNEDLFNVLIFVGSPGTGKSETAKAIANKLGMKCFVINSALLGNEYQDSAPQNIDRELKKAEAYGKPCVVVFEEIDAVGNVKNNDDNKKNNNKAAIALWLKLEECSKHKKYIVIGTTNSIKDMPEQIHSRLSGGIIEFKQPTKEMLRRIIRFHLGSFANDRLVISICNKTNNIPNRELANLIKLMRETAKFNESPEITDEIVQYALSDYSNTKNLTKKSTVELIKEHKNTIIAVSGLVIGITGLIVATIQYDLSLKQFYHQKSITKLGEDMSWAWDKISSKPRSVINSLGNINISSYYDWLKITAFGKKNPSIFSYTWSGLYWLWNKKE